MRNAYFGIHGPEDVNGIGGNAKLDEFRAAMGICNLRHIEEYINARRKAAQCYDKYLGDIPGIRVGRQRKNVTANYAYYPVYFDGTLRRVGEREFEGSRMLGTFCYNPQAVFPIYFVMRVNKTPKASGYWKKQPPMQGVEAEWTPDNGKYKIYTKYGRDISGDDIGAWYTFDTEDGEQIEVSVGVSFVSVENARENLP